MVRDRSSGGVFAAACPRKLVDTAEEKRIGFWVWEYVLKVHVGCEPHQGIDGVDTFSERHSALETDDTD